MKNITSTKPCCTLAQLSNSLKRIHTNSHLPIRQTDIFQANPIFDTSEKMRNYQTKKENTPGPGSYNIPRPKSAGAFIGTSSKRFESKLHIQQPGPGTYEHKTFLKTTPKSYIFGNSKRVFFAPRDSIPGPGQYTVEPLKQTRSFKIRGKEKGHNIEKVPGPGHYEYKLRPSTPHWSLSCKNIREVLKRDEENPGPNSYNPGLKKSVPSFVFGVGERMGKISKQDTPGPGAYKIRPSIGLKPRGRRYKMRSTSFYV